MEIIVLSNHINSYITWRKINFKFYNVQRFPLFPYITLFWMLNNFPKIEKAIKLGFNNFEAIVNDKDLITIQSLNEFVKLMQDYFPENIKK